MKKPNDNKENLTFEIIDDNPLIEEREDFAAEVPDFQEGDFPSNGEPGIWNPIVSSSSNKNKASAPKKDKVRKKKMGKVKKTLLIILIVLLGIIVALGVAFTIMYFTGKSTLTDNSEMKLTPPKDVKTIDNGNYIEYNGHMYRYKDTMTSILFMGVDKEDELGDVNNVVGTGGQADALYLIAIDTESGFTTTFQISRSTMCDINLYNTNGDFLSTENAQICLSYAYGDGKETSAENCVTSVRRIFYGLPVAQSYVAMDIAGISAINDAVGGVSVNSPVDYMEFEKGESYMLYGNAAERFVRSRDLSKLDSNSNRMSRQKAYLNAFISKTVKMTKQDLSTPITLYNEAEPYIFTNLTASKVSYLVTDLLRKGITSADIQRVPGEDREGKRFVEFYIDNDKFFKMIVDTFYVQAD